MADDGTRYSFVAEWYDTEASILRTFYLFYFPADNTIELFDLKNHRTFLKRTKCDGVQLDDIHLGGTVKIFSRQMNITDFGDAFTSAKLGLKKQKTFGMLKPDAVIKMGEIFQLIHKQGFKITKLRMVRLTKDHASRFYKEHQGKPFLPSLVEYVTSGPVVAMELMADNAVVMWRQFIGPTDSEVARRDAPGTIRAKFGKDKTYNAAHGSDSPEAAEVELSMFFPIRPLQHVAPKTTATFKNCSCCVVKPHAIRDGLLGDIIMAIQNKGFSVTAMEMFYLKQAAAEDFLEVYKGVVPEYPGMVSQLIIGASVALEIVGNSTDTVKQFRAVVGPLDPDIARRLYPSTLRARFGKDKLQNAIHCTDLPEDGLPEVQYFFKVFE